MVGRGGGGHDASEFVTVVWDDLLGRVDVKEDPCLDSAALEFLLKFTSGFIGVKG